MTNETSGREILSCSEVAPLVERHIIKEPLTPDEQATLEKHLCNCQNCEKFVVLSKGLSQFARSISEPTLLSTIDGAADQFFGDRRSKRRRIAAASIGVAAAAVIGIYFVLSTGPDEVLIMPEPIHCAPTEPTAIAEGVFMNHCVHLPPQIARDPDGSVRVTLTRGAVGLSVDPNRAQKLDVSVLSKFGKVSVKGTVFTVQVENNDAWVEVFRGVVEVQSEDGATSKQVVEKKGAWLRGGNRFNLSKTKENPLYAKLTSLSYEEEALRSNLTAARTDNVADTPKQGDDWPIVDAGEAPVKEEASIEVSATKGRIATLDTLLMEARSCLIDKDWECAASRYKKILRYYENRWESMSALISLAKIELRHLGKPLEALRHFTDYKLRYPDGPLIEEAVFGTAECHRRLGDRTKELATLRSFVAGHPDNPLAAKAKKRIRELEAR